MGLRYRKCIRELDVQKREACLVRIAMSSQFDLCQRRLFRSLAGAHARCTQTGTGVPSQEVAGQFWTWLIDIPS